MYYLISMHFNANAIVHNKPYELPIPHAGNFTLLSTNGIGNAKRTSHVMTDLRTTLDPEHLDELLLLRSQFKTKQSC
jgi:hypothetical protein